MVVGGGGTHLSDDVEVILTLLNVMQFTPELDAPDHFSGLFRDI